MAQILNKNKIIIFGVVQDTIINFRYDLILKLQECNYLVEIIVTNPTLHFIEKMLEKGVIVHSLNLKRRSYNLLNLFQEYLKFKKIIFNSQPDLIFSYTIKPILISSCLRKRNNYFKLILLFEGLGSMFDSNNIVKKIKKNIFTKIYKKYIPYADTAIFLNKEDKNCFESLKICDSSKAFCINGIGINLTKFKYHPLKINKEIIFLFIGRLIKEKGIYDFIEAAKIIKKKYSEVKFRVVGQIENDGMKLAEILKFQNEGTIEYLGVLNDIRQAIIESSVFVLPTYYNEGLPKSILESLAIGRAIVTTNTKGCNQTVLNGENGFFVPIKNPSELSNILIKFIKSPHLLYEMSQKSRLIAENIFSDKIINESLLTILNRLRK